jgi:hypothetical protein
MDDYLMNSFGFVHLGNRTSKPLAVTFDGKTWPLPPFPAKREVPAAVARAACRQHPLMGSENPYSPVDHQLLVYVDEWGMPADALEQSDKTERIDRSLLPPDRQAITMQPMPRRTPERANAGRDANFLGGS